MRNCGKLSSLKITYSTRLGQRAFISGKHSLLTSQALSYNKLCRRNYYISKGAEVGSISSLSVERPPVINLTLLGKLIGRRSKQSYLSDKQFKSQEKTRKTRIHAIRQQVYFWPSTSPLSSPVLLACKEEAIGAILIHKPKEGSLDMGNLFPDRKQKSSNS